MQPVNVYRPIFSGLLLLFLLACSASYTSGFPTPTGHSPTATGPAPTASGPVPSPTGPILTPTFPLFATPTNPPLFVFSTQNFDETGQEPVYTISARHPVVQYSDDPRALAFNDQMNALLQDEIAAFKQMISEASREPAFAASSLDGTFSTLFQNDRISSIKYEFSVYVSGAAHPYSYSRTVNYDFNQGRSWSLDELFLPGSNYLEILSNTSLTELSKRGFDVFTDGIAPTPENYRNWNVTADGLLITFDQYQVAAGAAGQQLVVVPYSLLQSVILPQGPLAGFSG